MQSRRASSCYTCTSATRRPIIVSSARACESTLKLAHRTLKHSRALARIIYIHTRHSANECDDLNNKYTHARRAALQETCKTLALNGGGEILASGETENVIDVHAHQAPTHSLWTKQLKLHCNYFFISGGKSFRRKQVTILMKKKLPPKWKFRNHSQ